MKLEEILPDVNSESVIRIGDDDQCLTLTQFKEIIMTAAISMKVSYLESLIQQGYTNFIDDMSYGDKFSSDGRLTSQGILLYKSQETKETYSVSDFQWFNSGENCKILQPGEKWQDGQFRIRITTEFVPNETSTDRPIEPSLDTFRENP